MTPHTEKHFTATEVVRDVVIGMSDGLTGAISASDLVVTAGLAEIAEDSIAMGLGGFLAAKSDEEHYAGERNREQQEIQTVPEIEAREVAEIFQTYGLTAAEGVPTAMFRGVQELIRLLVRHAAEEESAYAFCPRGEDCEEVVLDVEVDGARYLLVRSLPKPPRMQDILSPREQEIARMVAKGYPNKTIAAVLDISAWTVGTYLRRIFAKLGVSTRASMVARLMTENSFPRS